MTHRVEVTLNQEEYQIKLPIRMFTSKKKLGAINLGIYRNLYHYELAYQKKAFSEYVKPLLLGIPKLNKVSLNYTLYPQTKRRMDIMNVCSILDKYFSDCLVENGIIPDDDYTHVIEVTCNFGSIKDNEHVIVTIKKEEEINNMKIYLEEEEVLEALNNYVETLGIVGCTGIETYTDEDGNLTVEVVIGGEVSTPKPKTTKPKATRRGRPKREEVESVEETQGEIKENVEDNSSTSIFGIPPNSSTKQETTSSASKEGRDSGNSNQTHSKTKEEQSCVSEGGVEEVVENTEVKNFNSIFSV